jgi:hypothetical protein
MRIDYRRSVISGSRPELPPDFIAGSLRKLPQSQATFAEDRLRQWARIPQKPTERTHKPLGPVTVDDIDNIHHANDRASQ